MNPSQPSRNDGFQPKWRHFHPQATVWVHNPFDHDITFNVADEYNNPFQYRMRAGKTSELPGGAVATLGVKALVDELIQNDPKDVYSQWEPAVRKKWEDKVILRIKEAPLSAQPVSTGEVDLTTSDSAEDDEDEGERVSVDNAPAFPSVTQETKLAPSMPIQAPPISSIAESSLPTANVVIGDEPEPPVEV